MLKTNNLNNSNNKKKVKIYKIYYMFFLFFNIKKFLIKIIIIKIQKLSFK